MNVSAQESEEFQEPELLYMGWRVTGTDDDFEYRLWRPDGTPLASENAQAVEESLDQFEFPVPAGTVTHDLLLLIFRVDWRSPTYRIKTRITLSGTRRPVFKVGMNKSDESWVVVGTPRGTQSWPESCSVQIRYPVEKPVEIWKTEEPPYEDTQIAEGISCYITDDKRGEYLESCFRPGIGDWEEHLYTVSALVDGDDDPVAIRFSGALSTMTKFQYEGTVYFDPDQLRHVRAMKQTCRVLEFGKLKIREDLFPDQ